MNSCFLIYTIDKHFREGHEGSVDSMILPFVLSTRVLVCGLHVLSVYQLLSQSLFLWNWLSLVASLLLITFLLVM